MSLFGSARPLGDVGRLPSPTLGNFNGLRIFTGTQRLAVAGALPSPMRGNFSNTAQAAPDSYGSVGYTLVCRAASDFTTVLGIFYDYTNMSYTEELNAPGAGSVTFDLDDSAFLNQLINTADPETILDKDNLWEVYFDGQRKYMWLGQNVQENKLNDSEDNTVTISGPGIAETLNRAVVLPNRFPDPMPKLATLVDDFVDQDLDIYGRWKKTADPIGAFALIDSELHVSVSGTGSPGTFVASDYTYDFEDSGASVRVFPHLSTGTGYLRTHMRIEASDVDYVGMFVEKQAGVWRLVAESVGPSGYVTSSVPYVDNTTMRYWRIQEMDGNAIFSYKDHNAADDAWVTFATLPYRMVPTKVRLKLWVIAVAGAGLTLPQRSKFAQLSVNGVASPLPPFERYRRLILAAQKRGTIRHVIPDWTPTHDSMGATWVDDGSAEPMLGAGLLSVLDDYCAANRTDWMFTPDYRLQLRQKVYVMGPNVPDPTAPFHKENTVIFYEQESQLEKQRTRSYRDVANYLVGTTATGQYAVEKDEGSIEGYQQREALISDTLAASDIPSLRTSLRNQLELKKDGTSSWSVKVAYDVEGKRLYRDYELGDWVGVQSSGITSVIDTWRIAAISVSVSGGNDPEIELTLNAKLTPFWIRLDRDVRNSRWASPPKFTLS